jgi:hypothetical protein
MLDPLAGAIHRSLPLTGTPLPMINHPMFTYDKETPE